MIFYVAPKEMVALVALVTYKYGSVAQKLRNRVSVFLKRNRRALLATKATLLRRAQANPDLAVVLKAVECEPLVVLVKGHGMLSQEPVSHIPAVVATAPLEEPVS